MFTQAKQWLLNGAAIGLGLALVASPASRAAAAPASQGQPGVQNWTVLVGGEAEVEQVEHGPAGAWQLLKFYSSNVTINEGDSIDWKLNSVEMHNVIFPGPGGKYIPFVTPEGNEVVTNAPGVFPIGGTTYAGTALASSGQMMKEAPGVQDYKLTFTKAGTYNYYCSVHSAQLPNGQIVGMVGSVTVQAGGSSLVKSPTQSMSDAQAALAADAQSATAADAEAKQVPPPAVGANGKLTHHVNVGYDTQVASYMRFAPQEITLNAGDTIVWTQTSANTPHTITFPSGGPEPSIVVVKPQAAGPPRVTLNPQVLAPAGGSTYSGTGYFNSGFIGGKDDPSPGSREYSLTFSTPGTYEYICILHDQMGMIGHVTVLAAGATPGMPATGSASTQPGIIWLAGLLASLVLLSGGLILRRRKGLQVV